MDDDVVVKLSFSDDIEVTEDDKHNITLRFKTNMFFEKDSFIDIDTSEIYRKGFENGRRDKI